MADERPGGEGGGFTQQDLVGLWGDDHVDPARIAAMGPPMTHDDFAAAEGEAHNLYMNAVEAGSPTEFAKWASKFDEMGGQGALEALRGGDFVFPEGEAPPTFNVATKPNLALAPAEEEAEDSWMKKLLPW